MSLKRPHDSPPPDDRDRKRRHYSASLPVTPAASHISLSTPLKAPLTAYPPRPFDSPRNPFGRKWAKYATRVLPPPVAFGKHLSLRFQFVRIDSAGSLYREVYRTARVPSNYTFTHLRCLIAWLFCGLPGPDTSDEYLFEIKKNAAIYSFMYKPGQLKSGRTWAKISNTQDPYRWQKDCFSDDGEEQEEDELGSDVSEDVQEGDDQSEACGSEDGGDWEWKDEEDFTLAHAWPKGPDKERAILYHHSPVTQIHITIDHALGSKRSGISNTPYVLSACGRVWLSPPPLPRPVFAIPAKKIKSPGHKRKPASRDAIDEDTDEDYEDINEQDPEADDCDTEEARETGSETEDDEDDDKVKDIDLELDVDYWNTTSNGFAKFLARYMGSALPESSPSSPRVSSPFDHEEEYFSEGDMLLCPSTPGLTRSSSIPSSPGPTLATSSPRAPSCAPVHIASPSKSEMEDNGGYVILSLPALTPFPVKARPIRKRMKRVEERMGKIKKGKWACLYDEDQENERDELAGEGDGDVTLEQDKIIGKGVRAEETEPPDWDPFGDEEEL